MIRSRLLIGFILVGLLPVFGVGISTYILSYQNGKQQAIDRLESVSARKELAVQVWIQAITQELQLASQSDVSPRLVLNALSLSNEGISYPWYNDLVRTRLQSFVNRSDHLQELYLVDLEGKVVVSTDLANESQPTLALVSSLGNSINDFVELPFVTNEQAMPPNSTTPFDDKSFATMLLAVSGVDGKKVGYIGGKFKIDPLKGILRDQTGMGETGVAYLMNPDFAYLSGLDQALFAKNITSSSFENQNGGVRAAIEQKKNMKGVYKNPIGETVIGVYRWLPDLSAVLGVEQHVAEAFQIVIKSAVINTVLALGALIFAVIAALYMTQTIANPIINLSNIASQIAKGDLEKIATIRRNDEVGELAKAFNLMTSQLRDLISSLEQRVEERTLDLQTANKELRQRAIQLETSAKVARDITSILNIDRLLKRVVELIQETFGYYHVQVFLLDKDTDILTLGASSGNCNIQHQNILVSAQSINSQAIKSGVTQVVHDIQESSNFLYDKGLPETRSELVIPLKVGEKLIGTLDVHSAKVNAFNDRDITLLQSLGDQIAIAIENARLYNQSRDLAILEERHRLARELHDSVTQSLYSLVLLTEGWRRIFAEKGEGETENYFYRIGEIASQALKEMRLLILELRPPALEQEGLIGALQKRLDAVEKRVGIKARVVMEEFYEIPVSVEKDLYWIAQEALNNSLKHAQANQVTVWIYVEKGNLYLKISDDGVGFDVGGLRNGGGMGLANMYERAKRMGGELFVESSLGKGTTIKVRVPYFYADVKTNAEKVIVQDQW